MLHWLFPKHYEIYTDGSLKKGCGAWAYVITCRGRMLRETTGTAQKTTCNRMEFQAAIEALRTLPLNSKVTLYSDSRILVNTVTLWMADWKAQNWVKKNGRPIPSVDQIQILNELNDQHRITWRWIKAHSGIPFNERCDELCVRARDLNGSRRAGNSQSL